MSPIKVKSETNGEWDNIIRLVTRILKDTDLRSRAGSRKILIAHYTALTR